MKRKKTTNTRLVLCSKSPRRRELMKKLGIPFIIHPVRINENIPVRKPEKLVVVVGGEKVPSSVYEMADFNIAVGSQPHSEVAALAICLDRIMGGKELEREFDSNFNGNISLEPAEKGKKILKKS